MTKEEQKKPDFFTRGMQGIAGLGIASSALPVGYKMVQPYPTLYHGTTLGSASSILNTPVPGPKAHAFEPSKGLLTRFAGQAGRLNEKMLAEAAGRALQDHGIKVTPPVLSQFVMETKSVISQSAAQAIESRQPGYVGKRFEYNANNIVKDQLSKVLKAQGVTPSAKAMKKVDKSLKWSGRRIYFGFHPSTVAIWGQTGHEIDLMRTFHERAQKQKELFWEKATVKHPTWGPRGQIAAGVFGRQLKMIGNMVTFGALPEMAQMYKLYNYKPDTVRKVSMDEAGTIISDLNKDLLKKQKIWERDLPKMNQLEGDIARARRKAMTDHLGLPPEQAAADIFSRGDVEYLEERNRAQGKGAKRSLKAAYAEHGIDKMEAELARMKGVKPTLPSIVIGAKTPGGMTRWMTDFPGLSTILAVNPGIKYAVREVLPNYDPARDLSIHRDVPMEHFRSIDIVNPETRKIDRLLLPKGAKPRFNVVRYAKGIGKTLPYAALGALGIDLMQSAIRGDKTMLASSLEKMFPMEKKSSVLRLSPALKEALNIAKYTLPATGVGAYAGHKVVEKSEKIKPIKDIQKLSAGKREAILTARALLQSTLTIPLLFGSTAVAGIPGARKLMGMGMGRSLASQWKLQKVFDKIKSTKPLSISDAAMPFTAYAMVQPSAQQMIQEEEHFLRGGDPTSMGPLHSLFNIPGVRAAAEKHPWLVGVPNQAVVAALAPIAGYVGQKYYPGHYYYGTRTIPNRMINK